MLFPACTSGLIFESVMVVLKLIASHAALQLELE
jgi:hypothetical protein